MGFMPGGPKEKTKPYEAPYYGILQRLYNRGDAYDVLKNKGLIEFESTAFIRGITIENSIVIVDEAQNLNSQELNSLITRIGENCQIVFCGDMRQTDFDKRKEHSGLLDFYKIIEKMESFDLIEFGPEDIVRSKLVKEYIMTRMRLENEGEIKPLHV
jgi:phosphate starvation-inducible protein PhoH